MLDLCSIFQSRRRADTRDEGCLCCASTAECTGEMPKIPGLLTAPK